ncbi:hypothetical protein MKZ38_009035 [Zalerion maritima]|uniref:Uncharacterized protein n=1 Tax=Zalerion maritima TaxID=339359 RepID=A0AAD5RTP2_9PEZI|nr:hypothetical protein MKZ38_009035 [Zalerion maritima]
MAWFTAHGKTNNKGFCSGNRGAEALMSMEGMALDEDAYNGLWVVYFSALDVGMAVLILCCLPRGRKAGGTENSNKYHAMYLSKLNLWAWRFSLFCGARPIVVLAKCLGDRDSVNLGRKAGQCEMRPEKKGQQRNWDRRQSWSPFRSVTTQPVDNLMTHWKLRWKTIDKHDGSVITKSKFIGIIPLCPHWLSQATTIAADDTDEGQQH